MGRLFLAAIRLSSSFDKWLAVTVLCLGISSCKKSDKPKGSELHPDAPAPSAEKEEKKAKEEAASPAKEKDDAADSAPENSGGWTIGKRRRLGPAAATAATSSGVLFVTRDNQLLKAERDGPDGFIPIKKEKSAFAIFARGPSVSPSHAYWASEKGQLYRGEIKSGKVNKLLDKVRPSTRTSVIHAQGRDILAFIREVDEQPMAFLWAEKEGAKPQILQVSPSGSTASSVVLLAGSPHPRVLVLAGRTGMSPVHVRQVRDFGGRLALDDDEVVWIAPGSNSLTEIHALPGPGGKAVAFLPTAKNFSDFGLAQLSLKAGRGEIKEPSWRIFPNGLDPSPVATGHVCGKDYLLYVRPKEADPDSPQELRLAAIKATLPGEGKVIARARRFNDLSLAATKDGAIVAWTAGSSARAVVLTCPAEPEATAKPEATAEPKAPTK